jgi:hypothetical protein
MIQVSNLPPSIVREELRELCLSCGRVIDCEIYRKKGNPVGYVTFLTSKDASYAVYRLQDRLYRDNLLSASLVDPSQKPEKKVKVPKDDPKKKKVKKHPMSLRLLTPINPATPPPPQSALSQSNPSQTVSAPPSNEPVPVTVTNSSPLPKGEPEDKNSTGQPVDEYYNKNRRGGGRRGGGRGNNNNNNSNNNYTQSNNESYSKRGRRGRGRMNYVAVDKDKDKAENNSTSVTTTKPVETVPKPISPPVTQQNEKVNNPPPATQPNNVKPVPTTQTNNVKPVTTSQPNNTAKPVPAPNNRRQNNLNHSNNQAKYRPREDHSDSNPVSAANTHKPVQEEFELSLRNAQTNELRFSILVKSSDVEKVLAFYSSLKPY